MAQSGYKSGMTQASPGRNAPLFFETGHSDLIHDVQLDYFGKTLATASSDGKVKLFEVVRDKHHHIADLEGHKGPVWRISWAHPKYDGPILASCGYDRRVIIWQYSRSQQQYIQAYVDDSFKTSVNCIAFAPVDLGLYLIAGDSSGRITCYNFSQKRWTKIVDFKAHNGAVNGLSWSQQTSVVSAKSAKQSENKPRNVSKRFASCGSDNMVKIWFWEYTEKRWKCNARLPGHSDWVRDVSWAPIPGSISHSMLASCSEDKSVIIWKERAGKWKSSKSLKFNDKVWSVSWSELGNLLAIASGQNQVQLFKEGVDGSWNEVSSINA